MLLRRHVWEHGIPRDSIDYQTVGDVGVGDVGGMCSVGGVGGVSGAEARRISVAMRNLAAEFFAAPPDSAAAGGDETKKLSVGEEVLRIAESFDGQPLG